MPQAAIPAALPYVLGGLGIAQMVQQNVANKATIKNAENAAANSQRQIGQNTTDALGRLGQFNQQNPGIVTHPTGGSMFSGSAVPLTGGQPQAQAPGAQMGAAPGMATPGMGAGGGLANAIGQLTPQQIQQLIGSMGGGHTGGLM